VWKLIRRRVEIDKALHFEYEVSPHRAFLARIADVASRTHQGANPPSSTGSQYPAVPPTAKHTKPSKVGGYVPFKQARLSGQINPLRPPLHVETVLIGRALGQPTGYCFGVGYRIRDDGYVEAELNSGIEKYESFAEFKEEITKRFGS
jgi:hypothetical protein